MFSRRSILNCIVYPAIGLLTFTLLAQVAHAHGISDADKSAMLDGGYLRYVGLGASHMVTGYDHLLFLFGVMFFLATFRDIVKFVTVFTLGHSITLIIATFAGITANYFLVDAVIALSVCYKGFDNNKGFESYLGMRAPNLLGMVFVFGLIHGFGLSTRLQQLPLGEGGANMLGRIISFNVGVELGQIAALVVMVAILTAWRKRPSFDRLGRVANHGLILAGASLFLMQMHGYEHSAHASTGFSSGDSETANLETTTPGPWKDVISVTLSPNEGKEYKFQMEENAALEYAWSAAGTELLFDFHGEPTGDTSGYFKSYKKGTSSEASGSLSTPFAGTHGWYWKNSTQSPVVITLKVKGSYQRLDLKKEAGEDPPKQVPAQTHHETID